MNTNNPFNTEITETQTDIPVYPNHGRVFNNRYRLIDTIGKGGMGRVYKALDEAASEVEGKEKYVAIKVLLPQLSHNRRAVKRLQREALRAQELRHEHIVGVYNFDSEGDWTYVLMEWLDGESLEDAQEDELDGFALETVTTHLKTIGAALSYAHDKGIIHRDIKPNNIILTKEQRLVLIDFGLSQEAKQSLSRLSTNVQQSSGTVVYMPPEALVAGHPANIKDDIYGLAATVYELLTGYPPFIEAACWNRTAATPLPHKPPQLDETQWQVLSSALAFNPANRPESVAKFVNNFCSADHKEKQQQKELISTLANKLENATDKKVIKETIEEKAKTASLAELQQLQEQLEQQLEQEAKKAKRKAEEKARQEAERKKQAEARRQEQQRKEAKRQAEEKARQEAERQKQSDICAQRLWAWADKFDIPAEVIPRDKSHLLALQSLELGRGSTIYSVENDEWVDNPYKDLPKITTLPPEIGQLSQLQELHLNRNQLSGLPPEIRQLRQLQALDVRDNQLSSLPPAIGQLSQLQHLNLWRNQLSSLPPEIGQLSQLQELYVQQNQLSTLPAEIGQLSQLQHLNLWGNQLSSLPPEIGQLSQLQELHVRQNQLGSLPPEIGQLSQLQELYVQHNQLSSLPSEIGQLSQLQVLSIRGNKLSSLPASITNLTKLSGLDLSVNPGLTKWLGLGSNLSPEQKAFIKTIKNVNY